MVVIIPNFIFSVLVMQKKDIYTLVGLIILTIITALFATTFNHLKYVSIIILVLSIIKFILVSFQFMELKKAHPFWKTIILIYLTLFLTVIGVIVS